MWQSIDSLLERLNPNVVIIASRCKYIIAGAEDIIAYK
jgi:hypothetical protein